MISGLLRNLEVTVTNIAVRVVSRESDDVFEPIPTILFRVNRVDFTRATQSKPRFI